MEFLDAIALDWTGWIVSMTAQLLLLMGVFLIADRLLRKRSATIRYGLWSLVLLRLILPPTLSLPTGWGWWVWSPDSGVSVSPIAASSDRPPPLNVPVESPVDTGGPNQEHRQAYRDAYQRARQTNAKVANARGYDEEDRPRAVREPLWLTHESDIYSPPAEHDSARGSQDTAASSATLNWLNGKRAWLVNHVNAADAHVTSWRHRLGPWATVSLLIYLGIVCAQLGVLASSALQVRGWVRRASIIADQQVQALLDECREIVGVYRIVELRNSDSCTTPLVVGIFRPVILMPSTVLANLDRDELESVLIHELHHVRRRDPLVNVFQTIIGIAYFFHPLVWYCNARIRTLREDVCDEFTLHTITSGPKSYGAALLKVAEVNGYAAPPLALGALDGQSPLRKRMSRILDPKTARNDPWTALAWLIPLLAALVLLPCGARQTSASGVHSLSRTSPATRSRETRVLQPEVRPAPPAAPLELLPPTPAPPMEAAPLAPDVDQPATHPAATRPQAPEKTTLVPKPKQANGGPIRRSGYFADTPAAGAATRYRVSVKLQTGEAVRRLEGELGIQWLLLDAHDMTAMVRPRFDRTTPPNNGFPELLAERWFTSAHAQGWSRLGEPLTTDGEPLPLLSRSFASLLLPRLPQAGKTSSTYRRQLQTKPWRTALRQAREAEHPLFPPRIAPPFLGGPFGRSQLEPFASARELTESATTQWTTHGVTETLTIGIPGQIWISGSVKTHFGARVGEPIETNVSVRSFDGNGDASERLEISFRQVTETGHKSADGEKKPPPPLHVFGF